MERKEEFEFDLSELLQFLVRKVWISIIAMVICMIVAFVYVSNFVVPMYSAKASMTVRIRLPVKVFSIRPIFRM